MAQIRPEQIKLAENTLLVGVLENGVGQAKALQLNTDGNVSFAIVDGALKLSVDAGGITATEIADGTITSDKFATGAVTVDALDDYSITPIKLTNDPDETFVFQTSDQDWNNKAVLQVYGVPVSDEDVVNKAYVDSVATGLDFKESVILALDTNVDAWGNSFANPNPTLIDSAGDQYRLLLLGQNNPKENGIYQVQSWAAIGQISIQRAIDADTNAKLNTGAFVYVESGDYAGAGFVLQANNDGTSPNLWVDQNSDPTGALADAINFVQFNGATSLTAGQGITKPQVNEIAVKIDANSSALKFLNDNSLALSIQSNALAIDGDGLSVVTTGSGIQVGANGLELKIDSNSIIFNNDNLQSAIMHSDTLTGFFQSGTGVTGYTVSRDPVGSGKIILLVNGIAQRLGNGTATGCDAFFCVGAGNQSPLLLSQVQATHALYWNTGVAGFALEGSDYIDLIYQTNDY